MPYRIALDEPYVRVWLSGVVTGADLREAADELRAHERELGIMPDRLVDMSDMVATGTTFNLAILAARVRGVQRFPNTFRSALVSPKVDVAGFARIFRVLNRNSQIEVEVFDQLEAAEAWLNSPPSETPGE
ncbi:MAG: STAS/SEC14 domain-containing protein [Gemmatimonadota bacterium]